MRGILKNSVAFLIMIFGAYQVASSAIDRDHDGVEDKVDRCLNTTQLKKVDENFKFAETVNPDRLKKEAVSWAVDENGCEVDSDEDGVVNSKDFCPDDGSFAISKGVEENGCPRHSDGDGIPDYRDRCPGTPEGVQINRYGCPE